MRYHSKVLSKDVILNIPPDNKKIIWKKSPELFFLLFSALLEENYISTKIKRADEYHTAKVLYESFYVLPKTNDKSQYTFNSFYQNIKSSGSLQKDNKSNQRLKEKIRKFLKTIQPEELDLFD